jgi:hypothetical protein
MTVVAELAVNAVMNTQGMSRGTREVRSEMSSLASFAAGNGAAIATAAATAIAVTGTMAVNTVRSQGAVAESLELASERLGLGVENLQRYRYAAHAAADVLGEEFDSAIQTMNTNVGMAAQGLGKAGKALKELGLDAKALTDLSTDERLMKVADAIARVSDAADRTRLTEKIFGSGDLVNALNKGSQGFRDLGDDADRFGNTLSSKAVAALADADDEFDRLGRSTEGVKNQLATLFGPVVSQLTRELAETGELIGSNVRGLNEWLGLAEPIQQMGTAHDAAASATKRHAEATRELTKEQKKQKKEFEESFKRHRSALESAIASQRSGITEASFQLDTLGMTPRQQEIERIRRGGGNEALKKELVEKLTILDQLESSGERLAESERRRMEAQSRAAAITKQNLTPLQQYREELAEIKDLNERGAFRTSEDAVAAVQAARDRFNEGQPSQSRGANAAIKFGSVEAFRAVRDSRENELAKKNNELLKEGNKLAEETLTAIKAMGAPPIAPG